MVFPSDLVTAVPAEMDSWGVRLKYEPAMSSLVVPFALWCPFSPEHMADMSLPVFLF